MVGLAVGTSVMSVGVEVDDAGARVVGALVGPIVGSAVGI